MSIFELETGDTINAFGTEFQPVPASSPDAFDPTATGPDRFTIWIPSEQVALNLGNPVHSATAGGPTTSTPAAENTSAQVQIDRGFVAQTDNHIHFHTFGIPTTNGAAPAPSNGVVSTIQAQERTVVRLGTPATVPAAGTAFGTKTVNAIGSPTGIGSVFPAAYKTWNGYAMLTEGGAYQESSGTSALISGAADVRLAGNTQVLVGSPGAVQIAADTSCSILDFAEDNNASDLALANAPNTWVPAGWAGYHKAQIAIDVGIGFATAGLALGLATYSIVNMKHGRSPTPGLVGWLSIGASPDPAPALGGAVAWTTGGLGLVMPLIIAGATLAFDFKGLKPGASSGDVEIYASSGLSAAGAVTAAIHGGVMASLTSTLIAQVSGTVATTVSSSIITSVSGLMTQLGGTLSAGLTSQLGSAKVAGLTSTEISSDGLIWVTGKGNVQVNSTGGSLYLHGASGFYLGAGAGPAVDLGWGGESHPVIPGYGIQGTATTLFAGAMTTAGAFASPGPDQTKPCLSLSAATASFGTPTSGVAVNSSGTNVTGQQIQLG